MRKFSIALALTTLVVLAVPQSAAAADTKHSFGLFLGYLEPSGDWTGGDPGETIKVEADSAIGYGLVYQYRHNEKFSLGASLWTAKHDLNVSVQGSAAVTVGDATFMPFLIDGNFHVLKNPEKLDFYLGPTLGYAKWGDFEANAAAAEFGARSAPIENSFVYGANFGLDVPFGDQWAFSAGLRYLLVGAKIEDEGEPPDIDVNPWILTAGVCFRF